jgi:Fe-S oxidoreductase
MGLVHRWSRLAAISPALANGLMNAPALSGVLKAIGGIAPERRFPLYAREPFVRWFRRRSALPESGERVILWPDTFNNFFRPDTAIAATRVLEQAGYRVTIPRASLCCGRPLYDWGMLDAAKRLWEQTFATLDQEISAGTPVIGLEPACVSAFKDELVGLFPNEPRAKKLAEQTFFFSDFVDRDASRFDMPKLDGAALAQIHCHHHAVIKPDAERRVLGRTGLDVDFLPSGCCGMAGSFGFEKDKYEISMRLAERVLLPAVRRSPDAIVLANGFSCREQIEQATGRRTTHIAELLVARP